LRPDAYPFAVSFCSKNPNHPACKAWLTRLASLKGIVGLRAATGVQYEQAKQWLKPKKD